MNNFLVKSLLQLKNTSVVFVFFSISACALVKNEITVDDVCATPRPEVCTMQYEPVCGLHDDGSKQTYANGCSACGKENVKGYKAGQCS